MTEDEHTQNTAVSTQMKPESAAEGGRLTAMAVQVCNPAPGESEVRKQKFRGCLGDLTTAVQG